MALWTRTEIPHIYGNLVYTKDGISNQWMHYLINGVRSTRYTLEKKIYLYVMLVTK